MQADRIRSEDADRLIHKIGDRIVQLHNVGYLHESEIIEVETRRSPVELRGIAPKALASLSHFHISAIPREPRARAVEVNIARVRPLVVPRRRPLKELECVHISRNCAPKEFGGDIVLLVVPLMKEIEPPRERTAVHELKLRISDEAIGRRDNSTQCAVSLFKILLETSDRITGQWLNDDVPCRTGATDCCLLTARDALEDSEGESARALAAYLQSAQDRRIVRHIHVLVGVQAGSVRRRMADAAAVKHAGVIKIKAEYAFPFEEEGPLFLVKGFEGGEVHHRGI